MNVIEIKNLTKKYKEMEVLSSISFNIQSGELVAILGPSGVGKTTLFNIIAKVVSFDSGEIIIDKKNLNDYFSNKELAKKIGIIRQHFDLIDELPVIHNVLSGKLHEWGLFKSLISLIFPQEKNLAYDALKRVGLEDKAFEKTRNLSGGEKQRVAIARILVQKPKIILADEPVSSLDPVRAEDILQMLTSIVKEDNMTLLCCLHSIEFAKKYFNRIIGLKEGKICFDVATENLTENLLKNLYSY